MKHMSKYKYYFKKPYGEIVKDILLWLAVGGMVAIAATSPYFSVNLVKSLHKGKQYKRKSLYDTFSRLRREGYLEIKHSNNQMYVYLTKEGEKKAGRLQVNSLEIKKPKKWDGIWRVVIFDISQLRRITREAFRGRIRELGFYPLQKSVWVHPYECEYEIRVLQEFFGLSTKELQLIKANEIWDDHILKKTFKLEKDI